MAIIFTSCSTVLFSPSNLGWRLAAAMEEKMRTEIEWAFYRVRWVEGERDPSAVCEIADFWAPSRRCIRAKCSDFHNIAKINIQFSKNKK